MPDPCQTNVCMYLRVLVRHRERSMQTAAMLWTTTHNSVAIGNQIGRRSGEGAKVCTMRETVVWGVSMRPLYPAPRRARDFDRG